jgi:hypothetical protein
MLKKKIQEIFLNILTKLNHFNGLYINYNLFKFNSIKNK